ncbi:MAG: hypothetical protein E6Q81_03845, partial [Thermomonas sp.]
MQDIDEWGACRNLRFGFLGGMPRGENRADRQRNSYAAINLNAIPARDICVTFLPCCIFAPQVKSGHAFAAVETQRHGVVLQKQKYAWVENPTALGQG